MVATLFDASMNMHVEASNSCIEAVVSSSHHVTYRMVVSNPDPSLFRKREGSGFETNRMAVGLVSYTVHIHAGINTEGGPPGWHFPLKSAKYSTTILYCIKLTFLCMWSQKPPETVSVIVNFKIFQGEQVPRPPSFGKLPHARISPFYEKILYNPQRALLRCVS